MRRLFLVPFTIILLCTPAQAETITIGVKGMVCAFCATGLEKTFSEEAAIESVKVDLDHKRVTLETKPEQTLDDATIKERIVDAGFTMSSIQRVK